MNRRTSLAALALAGALLTSGCDLPGTGSDAADPTPTPTASATTEPAFDSQFTRDGTFQSHLKVPRAQGMDFVFTLYPTKATPRTNEWYPAGSKYLSFTFQAYDLSRKIRAPFDTKRLVYLSRVTVTSTTTLSDGSVGQDQPYTLNVEAKRATFDPEPLATARGMLVTSPKGAFELRNQEIGPVARDTIGVTLTLKATVSIETRAGSGKYVERTVEQKVPIAIFSSDDTTAVADIPVNAN